MYNNWKIAIFIKLSKMIFLFSSLLTVDFIVNWTYNNGNRTSRTSPRQRVMCPREDIFILGEK